MLVTLDEKMKAFLFVLRRKSGRGKHYSRSRNSKSNDGRNPGGHLKSLDLDPSYWAKSLFRRMGFTE